jgi:dTDP-4-dehydrorhamnose 3,5-epimerase
MISTDYAPESARGFRWNDATIGISWPIAPLVISARDASLPAFSPAASA